MIRRTHLSSISTSSGPASATESGRVLALDPGARRVGVALSDSLRITAQGLPTLERTGRKRFLASLRALVLEHDVCRLVVGYPLRLDGAEGPEAAEARQLATDLEENLQLPVELWDERLTSVQAERTMLAGGMRRARRRQQRDQVAAVLILQSWLDARTAGGQVPSP